MLTNQFLRTNGASRTRPGQRDVYQVFKRLKNREAVAVEAVIGELVSASYSLFRGKIQGIFAA